MRSSTSRCRVISITFPSHSHHIPSTFQSHSQHISIAFPSHLHHICITYPAHFNHIPITFSSHLHLPPPHASRPAAPNLSNLAFSGTVNQEHQTQHQTQPTPVAACCGDGLDRSCSAPTAVAACTIAARVPENSFMWRKSKRFKISKMKHETVQN